MAKHVRDVVLDAYLRDTEHAYELVGDRYSRVNGPESARINAQQRLLEWYASQRDDRNSIIRGANMT